MMDNNVVASTTWFVGWMMLTFLTMVMLESLADLRHTRPIVTKDPNTGQLYIPRSKITVGRRDRVHGPRQPRS